MSSRIVVLVFPPAVADAITVTDADMDRLNPDEFLNDTIIDFWLRYLRQYIVTDTERFIFFNSFFYKSMKKDTIHKWTKNTDIFRADYIFVPINHCEHWKLAIICFPGLVGQETSTTDKYPCIMLLDSLGSGYDSRVCSTIREYLEQEWKNKKNTECSFTTTTIKTIIPKVPEQTNFSDCGVFILRYIEKFCQEPPDSLDKVKLKTQLGPKWFANSEIAQMRKRIKTTIRELIKYIKEHKNLPEKPIPIKLTVMNNTSQDHENDSLPAEISFDNNNLDPFEVNYNKTKNRSHHFPQATSSTVNETQGIEIPNLNEDPTEQSTEQTYYL